MLNCSRGELVLILSVSPRVRLFAPCGAKQDLLAHPFLRSSHSEVPQRIVDMDPCIVTTASTPGRIGCFFLSQRTADHGNLQTERVLDFALSHVDVRTHNIVQYNIVQLSQRCGVCDCTASCIISGAATHS
eukprot:3548248-Amphidinium_carterae.1